ncbi:MAG: hypothetical protein HW406_1749 [Candidatus Brocadiaceae bacterium]|nr:hypothetical protein [Candidatus Brocadiaceae bacterium]
MIKLLLTVILGIIIGYIASIFNEVHLTTDFLKVRLFEIVQLLFTLGLGAFIAHYFSRKLNNLGKKRELICSSLVSMEELYNKMFDFLRQFMANTTSVQPKEITLKLKQLSSKISVLESRQKKLKLDNNKIENLRNAHEELNHIITGDSWGVDSAKISYSEIQIKNAEKGFVNIGNYLEELKYSLYD